MEVTSANNSLPDVERQIPREIGRMKMSTTKVGKYELMNPDDMFDALIKSIKAGANSYPFAFEFDLLKHFGWLQIENAAFSEKIKEGFYDRREMTEKEKQWVERYLSQLATASGAFGSYPIARELMAESWNYSRGARTLNERMLENVGDPDMTSLEMAVMGCESVLSHRRDKKMNFRNGPGGVKSSVMAPVVSSLPYQLLHRLARRACR
jgi:hypothetical protein